MSPHAGPRRSLFDTWALFYDLPLLQRTTYRPVHDAVLKMIGQRKPQAVLDVGCGTGQLATRVRRTLPAARVVGCDYAHKMLSQAAERSGAPVWVQGDAGRLPFRDQRFDCLLSTDAFHWFPDQAAALDEFRRVLKPGGYLILALVNPRASALSAITRVGSRFVGAPFYWPTRSALRDALHAAGFRVHAQHGVFRVPGFVLLPAVVTIAERPE
jgi:ubiquinone/menaquinone biosynthesis C-methylase UbiE